MLATTPEAQIEDFDLEAILGGTAPGPEVSVIVPTLNEAENLPALVQRIDAALRGRRYEVLIVDDGSRDGTPDVARKLGENYPVRLHARQVPKDGLSGAVLEGIARARGDYFVVMDGDLQHPPEALPALLAPLESRQADFTLGSRHVPGASMETDWGLFRRLNSWVATTLARPFAGQVSDPMSGFFALRRETFSRAQRLSPLGYKIALELMCKCRIEKLVEVPIHFSRRTRGQSKLNFQERFRYLEHLSRLYDFTFPKGSPYIKFTVLTLLGWLAAFEVLWLAPLQALGLAAAVGVAYLGHLAISAVFHARYVRTQREFLLTPRPWRDFWLIAAAEWLACLAVAAYLTWRLRHPNVWEVFLLSFAVATVVRYVLRKEMLQDLRGLRRELRREELT